MKNKKKIDKRVCNRIHSKIYFSQKVQTVEFWWLSTLKSPKLNFVLKFKKSFLQTIVKLIWVFDPAKQTSLYLFVAKNIIWSTVAKHIIDHDTGGY